MARDVRQLVGNNIRRIRTSASLTQATLAERIDVDRAYVSGLEQGARNPTLMTLWRVAEALDVPLRDLVSDAGSDEE